MSEKRSSLELLLAIQEEDIHADQLRYEIDNHPLQAEIAALHEKSVALDRSTRSIRTDRDQLLSRQAVIEVEVLDIDQRITAIDDRLRSDSSGSFRDQTAMANEMNSLAGRKGLLEDEELELMERVEPLDAHLHAASVTERHLHDRALEYLEKMTQDKQALSAELDEIMTKRDSLAVEVPDRLLLEYDRLRSRLGGIGAARLVHGMCSGCNLALSATELDRLRHIGADELVHCDQCGRILVH